MKKKIYIYALLAISIVSCKSNSDDTPEKPNIIFINVDDLGWMDTETYGSNFYETPNITKLAQSGMLFKRAYAGASNCAPSRACLMSGQNTPRHQIYTVNNSDRGNIKTRKIIPTPNTTELHDSIITIAEVLKEQGYATASFGKWHLGDDAKTQGFDVNVGGYHVGNPGKNGYFSPYNVPFLEDGHDGENLTNRLTNEALSFIKSNKDTPFFVYLPYYAVHTPLATYADLKEKYEQKGVIDGQGHAVYAGMIETIDSNLGKLMNVLDKLDLKKNTLLIFTSDNGGIRSISTQHPLRGGKGSYYEGGIRVPLIISWEGKIKPNSVSQAQVSNLDFYPTFLDILNVKPKTDLDGISMLPLFEGAEAKERSLFFHFPIYLQQYDGFNDDSRDALFRTRPGSVIIKGNWKLHHYFEDNALELYNLQEDIGERNNLAETIPKKAIELLSELKQWQYQTSAPIPTKNNPEYDALFEEIKINNLLTKKIND